jgi:FKBP-type peptidyl-prolyl cis-trans isomerase FklB
MTAIRTLLQPLALTCILITPAVLYAAPQTMEQKAAYAVGINLANTLTMQGLEMDPEYLLQGMKDALTGQKPVLSVQEMQQSLDAFKNKLIAEQQEIMQGQLTKNKQTGDKFLAANKEKPGVVTLPSGLQYKVIKSGDGKGPKPKVTDKVTTHYRGTLIDGTEFDSSYSRNKPATLPVNGVIAGWTEALQLMQKGDKWQLFIPSKLAYGERAVGNVIEPNSTLIFEIELIDIN